MSFSVILARLGVKGAVTLGGADSANKLVKLDADGLIDVSTMPADISGHVANTSNPHSVTKTQVGLGNCDNTSDVNKPISTLTQAALDLKADDSDLAAHTADATIHITSGQNSLLNALTATAVELNYVDGVTSSIQTQLDTNASNLSTHASDATIHITSGQNSLLDALTATAVELNYVDGVTSSIQTQIDALLPKAGGTMTGQLVVTPGANVVGETINGVVTGGSVTRSLLTINDDWTGATGGTSTPILLKLAITDTGGSLNYGGTKVMSVVRNGSEAFYMNHGGEMIWAAGPYISTNSLKIQVPTTWNFNWGGDLWLFRNQANSLQLGLTHATTPTAQTIGAHPVTTGTGADLTLQGGNGSVARGNVILFGGNRAPYDAAPSTTTIRDILISHGLMAAS